MFLRGRTEENHETSELVIGLKAKEIITQPPEYDSWMVTTQTKRSVDTELFFRGGEGGWSVKLTTHQHPVPRFNSTPAICLHEVKQTKSTAQPPINWQLCLPYINREPQISLTKKSVIRLKNWKSDVGKSTHHKPNTLEWWRLTAVAYLFWETPDTQHPGSGCKHSSHDNAAAGSRKLGTGNRLRVCHCKQRGSHCASPSSHRPTSHDEVRRRTNPGKVCCYSVHVLNHLICIWKRWRWECIKQFHFLFCVGVKRCLSLSGQDVHHKRLKCSGNYLNLRSMK